MVMWSPALGLFGRTLAGLFALGFDEGFVLFVGCHRFAFRISAHRGPQRLVSEQQSRGFDPFRACIENQFCRKMTKEMRMNLEPGMPDDHRRDLSAKADNIALSAGRIRKQPG